jgi:hypothetical protein
MAHLHLTWTDDPSRAVTAVAAVEGDKEFEQEGWQRVRGIPLDFQLFTTKAQGPPVVDIRLAELSDEEGGWKPVRWLGSSYELDNDVPIGEPAYLHCTNDRWILRVRHLLYKTDPPEEVDVEVDEVEEELDLWWFPLLVELTARLWDVRFV